MSSKEPENYTPQEPTIYMYVVGIPITHQYAGLIESDAPLDYTQELLLDSLKERLEVEEVFFEEFRVATEEEAAEYILATAENPTVN